jgi:hypothetical protein
MGKFKGIIKVNADNDVWIIWKVQLLEPLKLLLRTKVVPVPVGVPTMVGAATV